VGAAVTQVNEAVEHLAALTPSLSDAIDNALRALYRQPQTESIKRDIEQYRASVGPEFAQVRDAIVRLEQLAVQAKAEHDAVQVENARLRANLQSVGQAIVDERAAKHRVLRWGTALIVVPAAAVIVLWAIGL
jgi:hypothetical protein